MVNKMKICLLVEDDPDDQEFFMNALHAVSSHAGCYAVSNGEEALATLRDEGLTPDYIFTDIEMPRMNGCEFLRQLKESQELRHIPVIVYSSAYSESAISEMKTLGAVAFYSKARFKYLPEILNKYFGDRSFSIL